MQAGERLQLGIAAGDEQMQLGTAAGGEGCSWGLRPAASGCSSNSSGRRAAAAQIPAVGERLRDERRVSSAELSWSAGRWPQMQAARWVTSLAGRSVEADGPRAGTEGGSSGLAASPAITAVPVLCCLPFLTGRPPPAVPRRPAPPPANPRCGSRLLSASCRSPPVPQPAVILDLNMGVLRP